MENKFDLSNCDKEPIHIPGMVQSHGFVAGIDEHSKICFYSENIGDFLSESHPELLDAPVQRLEDLLGDNGNQGYLNQLISLGKKNSFEQINPYKIDIKGRSFNLIFSQTGAYYLLEFEPSTSDNELDIQKMIGRSISEMLADKNLQHLLNNSADQIKKVINYDRVMIYKFANDGHGEVVAEAKNSDLSPWLGLHYPASDIPKQARELYKINLTRIIANVHAVPAKIIAHKLLANQHIDLTCSQLRAVSPIHIQYMKNMKVDSSFSISLLYKKELWGLISCHNYTPRFIDYKTRESAKLIGQILSSALEFRHDEESQQKSEYYKTNVDTLSKFMHQGDNLEEALIKHQVTLLDAAEASGAVLIYENRVSKIGNTPSDAQLHDLLEWVKQHITESIYYTNNLSSTYPEAGAYKNIASGILVTNLSKVMGEYVIWFKPEQSQTIKWAGNPEKAVETNANGLLNISPRKSFEIWSENVAGVSKDWGSEEIKSAIRLKVEIISAINQKASEIRILNEKLKLAYDELDTFSFTISHDLKNPITVIKSLTQIMIRDNGATPQMQLFLGQMLNVTDKMNLMIREILEYSRIGRSELVLSTVEMKPIINELIRDLSVVYNAEAMQITIGETPPIKGDKGMLSQVFANLIGNSIKYSFKSQPPIISIEGKTTDTEVIYKVADNGMGIDITQIPKVFDLFKRMDNVKDIEGSGVGLAIVKRIIGKHKAKIWIDSELGKGSTFYVAFKK